MSDQANAGEGGGEPQRSTRGVLRSERTEHDIRHLGVRLAEGGGLLVEGQDLGPGVEAIFGAGLTEYEWAYTIAAEHVPRIVDLLGGDPDGDVIALLVARFAGADADRQLRSWLSDNDIPSTFWSRIGD